MARDVPVNRGARAQHPADIPIVSSARSGPMLVTRLG